MTTASGKRIGSRMNTRRREEEEEEEEALDLFVPDGEFIDPEVLSALPPSVRLEVIGKMRDKRMADNREHFAAASEKCKILARYSYKLTSRARKSSDRLTR